MCNKLNSFDKYEFVLTFFRENSLDYAIFDSERKLHAESLSDIDIIVGSKFILKDLLNYFKNHNWDIINIIRNDGYDQVYTVNNSSQIIHIDVIKKNKLRGIEIEPSRNLLENRYSNCNKFWFVDESSLFYFELMKSLLFSSKIPGKYFDSISSKYISQYQKKVVKNYGTFFNINIVKLLKHEKSDFNFQYRFIIYSVLKNPKNFFYLIYHYFCLFNRYINYPGIYIITEELKDFKLVDQLFTGVEYINKPKNIFEKVKNSIRLFRFRGELKLIVSNDNNFTFFFAKSLFSE